MSPAPDLAQLQQQWKTLFTTTLPALAKAKDAAQPKWPVQLDHCFARIILDNTVGEGMKQWDQVIGRPAVRNMSNDQLRKAIELGEQIRKGEVDLVKLDEKSLAVRRKQSKDGRRQGNAASFKSEEGQFLGRKRKSVAVEDGKTSPKKVKKQSTLSFASQSEKNQLSPSRLSDLLPIYKRIQSHPTLTPYRKRLYSTLLTVPRGHYTTYVAMSDYLSSSARAVGNGMRHNPFAPDVPCHRVLAADGSIGGFYGDWGKEGKYAKDKIELLRSEGVRFDSRGKVKGEVWKGFYDFDETKGMEGDSRPTPSAGI